MRVGQRLGLGFGIIMLLMIGMVVFVSLSVNRIGKTEKIVALHTSNLEALHELKEHIEHWIMTVEVIVKERNVSQLDYHEILKTSIAKKMREIDTAVYDKDTKDCFDEVVQIVGRIKTLDNAVQMDLRVKNKALEKVKIDEEVEKFEEDASKLTKAVTVLDEMFANAYQQTISYSKRVGKDCWLSVFVGVPLAVVFSILYAYFTTKGVTQPLNLLTAATKRIADGPLGTVLNMKSTTEIEELFHAFNDMVLKLSESNAKLERSLKTIQKQKDFFDTILSNTKDMIFIIDKENKIEYMNTAAMSKYGFALGKYCYHAICNQGTFCQQCGIEEVLKGQTLKMERTIQGRVYDSVAVPFQSGEKISKLEILRDITERKHLQDELEKLSVTDKLTGLYNRRYFDEALEKEMLRARRFQHDLSLLFIDIDKFKHFNDTYGHAAGDKVLQRLGNLIKNHVRNEVDIPCRYGGEEFTIILPEATSRSAFTIATRILEDFGNIKFSVPTSDETVQKTISIGVAELGAQDNPKALLMNADEAMYHAKKRGGNRVSLNTSLMYA